MAAGASSSTKDASEWFFQSRELSNCSASMDLGLGVVNCTNSDFQLSELLLIRTLRFLELAKGVPIIEVGLYPHAGKESGGLSQLCWWRGGGKPIQS